VALDVIRAIRREGALPVLENHLRGLMADTPLHPQARTIFGQSLGRALTLAAQVAEAHGRSDSAARQAATGLYHATTAIAMAWEAGRTNSARRMRIAQLVLQQRLLPHDPLAMADEPAWLAPLLEPPAQAPREAVDSIDLF
jgi:acyl-CoA dehydrogenase